MNKVHKSKSDKWKDKKKDRKEKKEKRKKKSQKVKEVESEKSEEMEGADGVSDVEVKSQESSESKELSNGNTQLHRVDPNLYKDTIRNFTLTMVVPSSIVDNAQSLELKTYLVGQVANAATLFCVNEIVIVSDDKSQQMKGILQDLTTTEFFV